MLSTTSSVVSLTHLHQRMPTTAFNLSLTRTRLYMELELIFANSRTQKEGCDICQQNVEIFENNYPALEFELLVLLKKK